MSARYIAPGGFTRRVFNPLVAWLTRRGLSLKGSAVLEVRGRTSGEIRTTPVNPLTLDGARYLVAPRGETEWVKNIRVAGAATLVAGKRRDAIEVDELDDADKPPIIRAYLEEWAWEVKQFFDGITAQSDDEAIAAVATGFPVFRIR